MVHSENTKLITVGELRKILKEYPDSMGVGIEVIHLVYDDENQKEYTMFDRTSRNGVHVSTEIKTNTLVIY